MCLPVLQNKKLVFGGQKFQLLSEFDVEIRYNIRVSFENCNLRTDGVCQLETT